MAYVERLIVRMNHSYYAPAPPPLTIGPADPDTFRRSSLLLRGSGAEFLLIEDGDAPSPVTRIVLDVICRTPEVISVTQGAGWRALPVIVLPLGRDVGAPEQAGSHLDAGLSRGEQRLARLAIELDPEGPRTVELRMRAQRSRWAYHVTGPGHGDVLVEDTEGEVEFEDLGQVTLPNGVPAKVIRSRDPLPLRARAAQRFALTTPGPFGPKVIVPILPVAGPVSAAATGAGSTEPPVLQSDIYVSIP